MSGRIKPVTDVETRVLLDSKRRCCLCVFLNEDWAEKHVQIVHVDRDASNSVYENLAALCLDHHDRYDTRHSQSKGYTPGELRAYRTRLVAALEGWARVPSALIDSPLIRAALQGSGGNAPDEALLPSGAVFEHDPESLVQQREGERAGNELLRLSRQGWLDARIESIGEVTVTIIGESPEDRARQLLVIGNAASTTWQIGLFELLAGRWSCVFNMLAQNLGGPPPLRVVPGDVHVAVAVEREILRGTGVLNRSTLWYMASSSGPRLVLEYPHVAWVSGWCGFAREIVGELSDPPSRLTHGTALDLRFRVSYSSDPSTGVEVRLFALQQSVRLEWDDDAGIFIPIGASAGALEEAAGWFGDGDEEFLRRHAPAIETIVRNGSQEQCEWLRRFLRRCSDTPGAAELRRLLRESNEAPSA